MRELNGGLEDYLRALQAAFPLDLSGRRVALDCANGATYRAAPAIFERLGAEVEAIAVEPDGRNINDGCGSTHLENLAAHVAAGAAEIGFAFDGDGDRVLAVDGAGRSHDGDELIALAARGMAARGELGGGVAVTVMSNFGFHRAMEEAGIEVATTQVGDRYVLDELAERDWAVGGEQSGHIIDTRIVATGDGIGRRAGDDARARRRATSPSAVPMEKLPQILVNVEVAEREAIAGADRGLGGGRAGGGGARGPRPGPPAPFGDRAAGPGDGRGADRRGGRGRLRAACRHRPPTSSAERPPLLLIAYVRNRRIRRRSSLPRPPGRRARETRVPRL